MQVDLADDRFDITYDPERVAVADMLGSIRKLEYEPRVVEHGAVSEQKDPGGIDTAELPSELADLFAAARASDKIVLVRFSGPG